MTDLRKAAEMALEALCSANPIGHALEDYEYHNKATEALRQAIEQAEYDKLTIKFGERAKEYLEGAKKSWEQEPVAWVRDLTSPSTHCVTSLKYLSIADTKANVKYIPVYTAPVSKPWVSLTDEEIAEIQYSIGTQVEYELFDEGEYGTEINIYPEKFARAIEATLRSKNHDKHS